MPSMLQFRRLFGEGRRQAWLAPDITSRAARLLPTSEHDTPESGQHAGPARERSRLCWWRRPRSEDAFAAIVPEDSAGANWHSESPVAWHSSLTSSCSRR